MMVLGVYYRVTDVLFFVNGLKNYQEITPKVPGKPKVHHFLRFGVTL